MNNTEGRNNAGGWNNTGGNPQKRSWNGGGGGPVAKVPTMRDAKNAADKSEGDVEATRLRFWNLDLFRKKT